MRIAFVTTEFITERNSDGGLANYLKRVCLSLKEMGHEPILFLCSDADELTQYDGIPLHRVNVFKKPARLYRWRFKLMAGSHKTNRTRMAGSWQMAQAVQAEHGKNPIDIIQYTNINGIGFFRVPNIPCVARLSSFRRKWIDAYELPMTPKLADLIKLEEEALRRMDAVFGPSQLVADLTAKALDIPVDVIETPFFNEVTRSDPGWYETNLKNKRYVLFAGRLGLMKGIKTIAEMSKALLEKHPDLHLVLIGQNASYNDRPALDVVKEHAGSYADRILHFDKLDHERLYPVIEHAEAILLPSRIDNLSNICIEAMGLGQLVIGTRGASFDQLIDDGESGFLCDIDNADSLLLKTEQALTLTPEERARLSQNAKTRIRQLRPELTVNQLLDFYKKIITDKTNGQARQNAVSACLKS